MKSNKRSPNRSLELEAPQSLKALHIVTHQWNWFYKNHIDSKHIQVSSNQQSNESLTDVMSNGRMNIIVNGKNQAIKQVTWTYQDNRFLFP